MHTRFALAITLLFAPCLLLGQTPDIFKGHADIVLSLALSPDGKTLATSSSDSTVKLWDFGNGKVLETLKDHKKPVYSVAFSPDGKYLASGSQDTTIRLWNPKDGKFIRELKGHTDIVHGLAFSADSKLLASCGSGKDKSVRLWNPEDTKELKKLGEHKDSVYHVAFTKDGKYLASCSNDATIKIWDVKGQKELKTLDVEMKEKDDKGKVIKSKDGILVVAFLPDNKLLSGGNDKYLRVWDVESGKELKKMGPMKQYVYGLAVSKDGKKAATAGYGGELHVWEVDSGKDLFKEQLKERITYSVAFSPDESALITCHEKSTDKKDKGGVVKVTKIKAATK